MSADIPPLAGYTAYDNSVVGDDQLKITIYKKPKIGNATNIARVTAPKTAQFLYNFVRIGHKAVLRNFVELLRVNSATRILSALVLLSIDTVSFARRRISRKQYMINLTIVLMLVVGGTIGWVLGAKIGGFFPRINSFVAVLICLASAIVLGMALCYCAERLIYLFVKTDADDMLDVLSEIFSKLAREYLLNADEIESIKNELNIGADTLRKVYVQPDRDAYGRGVIEPLLSEAIKKRPAF